MRIKAPKTIATFPDGENVVVYNYLLKQAVACPPQDIFWLLATSDWTDIDELCAMGPQDSLPEMRQTIEALVESGILLAEESETARLEAEYTTGWELGSAAGLFHFTIMDNVYDSYEEGVRYQQEKALTQPSPELLSLNGNGSIQLQRPDLSDENSVLATIERRRTRRNVLNEPISLAQLGDSLFAGLGINKFIKTPTSVLPLKMTPSGGARNPYEAYVVVQNVKGLEPAVYHYSGVEHSLMKIGPMPSEPLQNYVQRQEWADAMPAMILLVANLERVSWKYGDPNAYRVVMMEAGHIAQNIMLSCTGNGLTACPTAALNHREISNLVGIRKIAQTPVYALLVGKPGPNEDQGLSVEAVLQGNTSLN